MSPVTVFMCEEIWEKLGGCGSIHAQVWPKADDKLAQASDITFVVQVNGKIRDKIDASIDTEEKILTEIALKCEKVQPFIEGKQIVKTIVVPKKLVNIVVK
jgi:leucyl-tRNA synthetase